MELIKGLNWADARDNFQTGVVYPSGLTAGHDRAAAAVVADRIVGQMYSLTGADTVRMPLNEATVSAYWPTYRGAIDAALGHGRVILAYWAAKGGRPADPGAFRAMWTRVIGEYGGDARVFLEPINEPRGLRPADLNDFYNDWLAAFPSVQRERIILDGSKHAQMPATVGADGRLDGCLLGYHEYSFFDSVADESAWRRHIQTDVGPYRDRTVCTEFGAVMNAGVLGKKRFENLLDYGAPSRNEFVRYLRAATEQFREWGMGSVYWPGVRDGDVYALCSRTGDGAGTTLTLNNASGLSRVQFGWGVGPEPPAGA